MTHVTTMQSDGEQQRTMLRGHVADDTGATDGGLRRRPSNGDVLLCIFGIPALLMFLAACVWAIAVG